MEPSAFAQCVSLSLTTFRRLLCTAPGKANQATVANSRKRSIPVCCSGNSKTNEELEAELKSLEGTELKWAEIDFPSVEDELRAIDDYMKEEEIDEDDAWPMFLRAAAYESRGQSHLALAQLSKIQYKAGIAKTPNLWERRAYNSFKIGDIPRAHAYFDVALNIYYEAGGNELHFAHWFQENFKDYMPRHNGPGYGVQRGICKYCVGLLKEARQCLVGGIIIRDVGSSHAVLWLLASSLRGSTSGKVADIDMNVIQNWQAENEADVETTLQLCLDLYIQCASGKDENVDDMVAKLVTVANGPESDDSLTAAIYLALYYDAIAKSNEQRDLWLEKVASFPGGPRTPNSLDFVYHAAMYRFSGDNFNTNEDIFAP